jgi:hypothetical protein
MRLTVQYSTLWGKNFWISRNFFYIENNTHFCKKFCENLCFRFRKNVTRFLRTFSLFFVSSKIFAKHFTIFSRKSKFFFVFAKIIRDFREIFCKNENFLRNKISWNFAKICPFSKKNWKMHFCFNRTSNQKRTAHPIPGALLFKILFLSKIDPPYCRTVWYPAYPLFDIRYFNIGIRYRYSYTFLKFVVRYLILILYLASPFWSSTKDLDQEQ